jgi:hypothetical protein
MQFPLLHDPQVPKNFGGTAMQQEHCGREKLAVGRRKSLLAIVKAAVLDEQ